MSLACSLLSVNASAAFVRSWVEISTEKRVLQQEEEARSGPWPWFLKAMIGVESTDARHHNSSRNGLLQIRKEA